jgi:hypothetical protein
MPLGGRRGARRPAALFFTFDVIDGDDAQLGIAVSPAYQDVLDAIRDRAREVAGLAR